MYIHVSGNLLKFMLAGSVTDFTVITGKAGKVKKFDCVQGMSDN